MDIRVKSLEQPMDVSEYLFRRLHEVGVRSVHGVPGDYNLVALDYLPKTGLRWVGSVNELNAGEFYPRAFSVFLSFYSSFFHSSCLGFEGRGLFFI